MNQEQEEEFKRKVHEVYAKFRKVSFVGTVIFGIYIMDRKMKQIMDESRLMGDRRTEVRKERISRRDLTLVTM